MEQISIESPSYAFNNLKVVSTSHFIAHRRWHGAVDLVPYVLRYFQFTYLHIPDTCIMIEQQTM